VSFFILFLIEFLNLEAKNIFYHILAKNLPYQIKHLEKNDISMNLKHLEKSVSQALGLQSIQRFSPIIILTSNVTNMCQNSPHVLAFLTTAC